MICGSLGRATQSGIAVAVAVAIVATAGCSGASVSPSPSGSASVPATEPADLSAVSEEIAAGMQAHFDNSNTGAYDNVRAVLVTVGGQRLVERYYESSADATSNVHSVTKSVMSALIGIALDEGHLDSVDQTLADLLPSHVAEMSLQAKGITLRQLLTMTGGLPSEGDVVDDFVTARGWVGKILADGPIQPPGQNFAYSSDGSHLLSAIMVQATGQSVLHYARERLFAPLGIDTDPAAEPMMRTYPIRGYDQADFAWPTDPEGVHLGWCCLKLTARDMAKLGQLWLNDGDWNGTQLVSAQWVTESTQPHVETGSSAVADQYGYHWWVTEVDGQPAFAAAGVGGQLVAVVPALDLVVVVSSIADVGNAQAEDLMMMVSYVIVPTLRN
jgi:CubicO group peptidase (beta-lactamase class C family)